MSAYTPGPWSWDHNGASDGNTHCIEIRGVGRTGDVAYCQSYTNGDYDDRDETIANARLIAKAPEMYERIKQLAEDLEDGHWSNTKAALRKLVAEVDGEQA